MKADFIATLVVALFSNSTTAQPTLEIVNGVATMEAVMAFDGLPAADLHERALNWFGTKFTSAKDVITSSTPSQIVGNFIMVQSTSMIDEKVMHRIVIDFKDGRIRVKVDNLSINYWLVKDSGKWREAYAATRKNVEAKLQALFTEIEDSIAANKGDW